MRKVIGVPWCADEICFFCFARSAVSRGGRNLSGRGGRARGPSQIGNVGAKCCISRLPGGDTVDCRYLETLKNKKIKKKKIKLVLLYPALAQLFPQSPAALLVSVCTDIARHCAAAWADRRVSGHRVYL